MMPKSAAPWRAFAAATLSPWRSFTSPLILWMDPAREGQERNVRVAAEARLEDSLFTPEQLPDALDEAGRILGFDYLVIGHADVTQARVIASQRARQGTDLYFKAGWAAYDYRVHDAPQHALGQVYLERLVPDWEQRRASAIYNEFFRPLDMSHYAGVRFMLDDAEWFCSAMRGEASGEISITDAEAFGRVATAAIRVAALGNVISRARLGGLLEGFEISGTPAIVLNRDGRVQHVTSAAGALFDETFGVRDDYLWAATAGDADTLAQLEQLARSRLASGPQTFVVRSRTRPVRIEAARVTGIGLDELFGAQMLLVLKDMGASDRALVRLLVERFGLSQAEADVVVQFSDGHSIAQIATRRNVVETTIREQMKSIYRKTGVHRQVDLLRLVSSFQR